MFNINRALPADFVRLDQDILSPLAGKKELYTYQTLDFWEQIKTPGYTNIFFWSSFLKYWNFLLTIVSS